MMTHHVSRQIRFKKNISKSRDFACRTALQKDTFLMNLNGQGKSVMLTADLNLVYKKVPYCFGQQSQNQCPVPLNAQVKEQYVQKFAKVCIFFSSRQ